MAADLKIAKPPRLSPLAFTFDSEIKRMAEENGLEIREVMSKLAGFTGLCDNHLYNYRTGKTSIPAEQIPEFCRQFQSNALVMALVGMCGETEIVELDQFDLARACSSTVRSMLKGGDVLMEVCEDGKIDGYEEIRISKEAATINAHSNRLLEFARATRRRNNQPTAPMAA